MQVIIQVYPSTYEIEIGISKNYILTLSLRCFHENCSPYCHTAMIYLKDTVEKLALSEWTHSHFIDLVSDLVIPGFESKSVCSCNTCGCDCVIALTFEMNNMCYFWVVSPCPCHDRSISVIKYSSSKM